MDDLRVLWMRDRVYAAFRITDPQLFEELLNRNDGEGEELILHFLNQISDEEGASTLFFYRKVVPEEVEVEIGEPPRRGSYSSSSAVAFRAAYTAQLSFPQLDVSVLCRSRFQFPGSFLDSRKGARGSALDRDLVLCCL